MSNDSDFLTERRYLADTLEAIRGQLEELPLRHVAAADAYTESVISWNLMAELKDLRDAEAKPYFQRIDFQADGRSCEKLYIGYLGLALADHTVIDWRSDVAALRHLVEERVSYECPMGRINGKLLLNRSFVIRDDELKEMHDSANRYVDTANITATQPAQRHLLNELYRRGEARLNDIVATLQKEQEAIIRLSPQGVLVVNGVAGSGKTQIAFHRLAYLLSPENQRRHKLEPGRTMVFVPSDLFLDHVREILPNLHVGGVQQKTFNGWASRTLFPNREIKVTDRAGEALLQTRIRRETKRRHLTLANLKGSLRFVALLDRLLEYHRRAIRLEQDGFRFTEIGSYTPEIHLSKAEISTAHARTVQNKVPFKVQRRQLKANLMTHLTNQAWKRLGRGFIPYQDSFKTSVASQLDSLLNTVWPTLNASQDYFDWLADETVLRNVGEGLLTTSEVVLLATHTKIANRNFDLQDLHAIFYLHSLIEGVTREQMLDHIVIDEGQDFSPLQYHTLSLYQRFPSLTVVGDVAQGIFAHRGLSKWQVLEEIFGVSVTYLEVTQNYRSTEEIVIFNNQVLNTVFGGAKTPAKPFARPGQAVPVMGFDSFEAMVEVVRERLEALHDEGVENIALILKDDRVCRTLLHKLKNSGYSGVHLTTDKQSYSGGLAVLTPSVSKGLEFPVVLVLGVGADNYNRNGEADGSLLYVALTRALHHLEVMFVGDPSPFLREVIPEGIAAQKTPTTTGQNKLQGSTQPAPFHSFENRGGTNQNFDTQDGSKGMGQLFRDNGRFGSFPLHDRYDDESDA